jgi:VanZ family protein
VQPAASSQVPPPSRAWLWGPVVAYCALIFGLSSMSSVPTIPGVVVWDKLAHAVLYLGLGVLLTRALSNGAVGPGWWPVVFAVIGLSGLYGLSDEFHQLFVPTRQFDLKDLAADVVGAGLGAGAWWLWGILRGIRDAA